MSKDTHVVIEGFPRSANSFAVDAFLANQGNIRCATHLHSSAQVVQACRWMIPTLVLLREVGDAVCADVAFKAELASLDVKSLSISIINDSLNRYILFYERIAPFYGNFHIGHFPDVISDFGAVMRDFNQFFSTDYIIFDHTADSAAGITSKSHHIGPTAQRSRMKAAIRQKYDLYADKGLKARGQKIYEYILAKKGLLGASVERS